jgi:hypothetical protein
MMNKARNCKNKQNSNSLNYLDPRVRCPVGGKYLHKNIMILKKNQLSKVFLSLMGVS